jgi:HEAT repeat protein
VRIVGEINDPSIIPKLEMQKQKSSGAVAASIVSVLYQLGKKEYKSDILVNLTSSDPTIRISAASTFSMFEEPATKEMLASLKDPTGQVRMHAVEALTKFPTKDAVGMLLDILYNDVDESAKQLTINALVAHAENGLAKGLAKILVNQLYKTEVPKDRLRIIAILRAERLRRQIKANPYDNLEFQLSEFFQEKEDNDMVKAQLSKLLNDLDAS